MRIKKEDELSKILKDASNPEIQLVFKYNKIEINTLGYFNDCENACLVTYEDFLQVNDKILKEGHKKLNVMRNLMDLNKIILHREWKHKCMLTKFNHLKEHLKFIQKTKVSQIILSFPQCTVL